MVAEDEALVRAFQQVAGTAARRGGIEPTLRAVVTEACELFRVDRGSIFLRGSRSTLFHGVVAETPGDRDVVRRMLCGVSADRMSQEMVATRAPVLVSDAARDGRPVRSTMVSMRVKEVLGVPLVLGDDVHGLLFLDRVGRRRDFTEQETRRAATYARLVAGLLPGLRQENDLRAAVRDLDQRYREIGASLAATAEMARLSTADSTPQDIARALGGATDSPCWITDGAHRLVARHGDDGPEGWITTALTQREAVEILRAGGGIVELPGLLVAPVTVHGTHRGHVTLSTAGRRPTDHDRAVLRSAAAAVAVELRVDAGAHALVAETRGQIARALVEGNLDTATRRRAAAQAITLERPRVVCLVAHRDDPRSGPAATDVAAAFEAALGGCPVLATALPDGSVAVLVDVDDANPRVAAEQVRRIALDALRIADADDRLVAAVSSPAATAGDVAGAYVDSRHVLHGLTRLCAGTTRVLTDDDLGFAGILLRGVSADDADRHVRRTLGPLLTARGRDRAMLRTVEAFFAHGRSIRDSARALDVHENTVRYRLTRVREITGLDLLTSADDQVSAQLALLILRLRGGNGQLDAGH